MLLMKVGSSDLHADLGVTANAKVAVRARGESVDRRLEGIEDRAHLRVGVLRDGPLPELRRMAGGAGGGGRKFIFHQHLGVIDGRVAGRSRRWFWRAHSGARWGRGGDRSGIGSLVPVSPSGRSRSSAEEAAGGLPARAGREEIVRVEAQAVAAGAAGGALASRSSAPLAPAGHSGGAADAGSCACAEKWYQCPTGQRKVAGRNNAAKHGELRLRSLASCSSIQKQNFFREKNACRC